MSRSLARHVSSAFIILAIPVRQGLAQSTTRTAAASVPAAAEPRSDPKKILDVGDYGRWNRITHNALSPDGKWMTYAYQPNDGDGTLYVKELDGTKVNTIPITPPQPTVALLCRVD